MARIVGTTGNDSLVGTSSADTIEGLAGNDTLVGLGSSDTLLGGIGDDRYVVGSGDVLSDSGGIDTVESSVSWTLGTGFENLIFTGTAVTSGTGTDSDNLMVGNSAGNWMRGRGGNDTLIGGGGNDTFNMRLGADGTYGNDSLDGGSGVDTLDYGATATTAVVIDLSAGTASGGGNGGAGSASLVSIENANGSAFDDRIIGSDVANFLFGFDGNDTLNGGAGNDRLEGGAGNDSLNGGTGNDTLLGGASFDSSTPQVLDGGTGADSMSGGAGSDVYFVDDAGDSVSDTGGHDAIFTTISLVAPTWLEQLTLMGAANANITGNDLSNNLHGNSGANAIVGQGGNDFLMGGLQNDTLTGGTGADQFYFGVAPGAADADSVTDFAPGVDKLVLDGNFHANVGPSGNFASGDARFFAGPGANSAQDSNDRVVYDTSSGRLWYDADGVGGQAAQLIATLQGAPAISAADISVLNGGAAQPVATEGDDTLDGTPGNDTIDGRGGNDSINGRGGSDTLVGGAGNDVLVAGDQEVDEETQGSDLLIGGDGDDVLNSLGNGFRFTGNRIDTLDGGLGNDTYYVDHPGDVLSDSGGVDSVIAQDIDWTLGAGFENLHLDNDVAEVSTGIGNELNNVMSLDWDGFLDGRGGNDTITGGFRGTLHGGEGNDLLVDGDDADGGAGDDTFVGSLGATGGLGADNFDVSRRGMTVSDFSVGEDKIRLDGTFLVNVGPNGTFSAGDERFYAAPGATAAHDASDRLIYNTTSGELFYDVDGTGGNFAPERVGNLQQAPSLSTSDIVVVNGSEQGQAINGTSGSDSLNGTSGNDTINGFAGNDTLTGAEGADSLSGGDGNDRLDAGQSHPDGDFTPDTLAGGLGDDVYFVSGDGDVILSDPGGIDTVHARNTGWTLGAGLENLFIDDTIGIAVEATGNELNNHMESSSEGGTLIGLGGDDFLVLVNVQNTSDAHGGDGNDTLDAGRGSDLFGDAGDDVLIADFGAEMNGGVGADAFVFETLDEFVQLKDFATGIDTIRLDATIMPALGTSGRFSDNDERFHAGAVAAETDDRVIWNASSGQLWYDADGSGSGVALELATLQAGAVVRASDIVVLNGTTPPPPSAGQTINGSSAPETLTGGAGNDTISGAAGSDRLFGLDGNDSLLGGTEADNMFGGNGNDWLDGDAGQDRLNGDAGADSFVFNDPLASANADYVNDFASGSDKLLFDDAIFTRLGGPGSFSANDERFVAASGARNGVEADDRLMYDTSTGKLYYDPDGAGGSAAFIVGVVQGAPTLVSTDITII